VRTALATPVKDTRTAEKAASAGDVKQRALAMARHLTHPRTIRSVAPWVAVVSFIVVIGTLVLMLEDVGRISAVASRPTPTPKPTPTPTALPAVTPFPSPMAGYKLYPDLRDGFYIQYPEHWTITPTNGQVQFIDDPSSSTYLAWVIIPTSWSNPGQGANTDDPSAWVDYVLTNYYGGGRFPGTFTRTPGEQPTAMFAGEEWQTGGGIAVADKAKYRVEVYATIHDGNPFIISLNARDDQFDTGRDQFFEPMLRSFTFLDQHP
jgi:hypothetical protein